MDQDLAHLRDALNEGMKLSMQMSYARRAPEEASVPYLRSARDGLRLYVGTHSSEAEAWHLLSLAEECLLNYGAAIACAEKSLSLSTSRNKKHLKRLAALRERRFEWRDLGLTPSQLSELGKYLKVYCAIDESTGRTMECTKQWLKDNCDIPPDQILQALSERGAHTDWQVYVNVAQS